ncbi:MAG: cysteine--tRNA ligase [Salibaculum sp.]|uniref:cysteine--tRNA ligase n=1 Tax=Salibaculum sp. TaxID=2855480 RepID=UPI00286FFF65|nr:cysteine--tRNA ligase [Salibaculum sp.]MDR9428856.1 cysteine--tRNA ligase [Salibaculum sp.]MDR9483274.1 cysteine--tRNA ligase [Salibaculum sp.]
MVTIELYNTRTKTKAPFVPLDPQNVRMYVCGPTVYDRAHLGNARPAIVFDVLYRLLRHEYGADHVTYVRNFTDVDDKINARAAETGREISDITAETTQWYLDDMAEIGVLEPDKMPRATDYIAQMVAMIEDLIARGHAYAAEGHVLFAVDSWKEAYGRLSGRTLDDMIAGARVEVAPYKRNPMDFVLWKPSEAGEPGWDGPVWEGRKVGVGRPGWHIECSAMAKALLGEVFDIHGGGNDLMFPHHENEIAQSCCANGTEEMARVWMHNEMLQVEGRKMSKSLGNFFTVRDLLDQGVPGEVIRFVMLSTHYRKPMDWTQKKREEAERALRRWRDMLADVEPGKPASEIVEFLRDDLNTAGAINFLQHMGQALFQKSVRTWSERQKGATSLDWYADASEFVASAQLLGLLQAEAGTWVETPDLHPLARYLADVRNIAMQTKDFSQVDRLKSALIDAGVEVRMSKDGVDLIPGPGFDPAKLEGLK